MYVERYVRWGCILKCFMPSSLLAFAVLLSLHLMNSNENIIISTEDLVYV